MRRAQSTMSISIVRSSTQRIVIMEDVRRVMGAARARCDPSGSLLAAAHECGSGYVIAG